LLGAAALAGRGLTAAFGHSRWRLPAATATAVALGACAVVTSSYVPAFRSNATLWAHELRLHPENPLLHLYAARAAWSDGRLEDALREARIGFERARHPDTRAEATLLWAQIRLQRTRDNEMQVLESLRDFFDAWATGHEPRLEMDGITVAVEPLQQSRQQTIRSAAFRSARAVACARTGRWSEAATQFRDLLEADRSAGAHANLVRVLACEGRWDEALQAVVAGLALHPQDALLLEQRRIIAALQATPASDLDRAVTRARMWLALGSTLRARQELEPWRAASSAETRWVEAMQQVETAAARQPAAPAAVEGLFR
jgi:tetratricopeptide (TPR) repeat protein